MINYGIAKLQAQLLQLTATLYPAKWLKNADKVYRDGGRFASQDVAEGANKALSRETPKPKKVIPSPKRSVADYPINEGHIFEGDISRQGKLMGGMHTQSAIDDFVDNHGYDYKTLRVAKNGVKEIELPEEALQPYPDGRLPERRKTLFPEHWDDDYILDAIRDVVKNNEIKEFNNRQFVEGTFDGVKLRVALRNARIVTAYPKMY